MKLTEVITVLVVVVLSFFLLTTFSTNTTTYSARANEEYTNMLITACHDSVKSLDVDTNGLVFADTNSRNKSLNRFYKSLEMGFNTNGSEDMNALMRYRIPVICIVDNNGYYMYYYDTYHDNNGYTNYVQVETPLNTWSIENSMYIYRFHLTDDVTVFSKTTGKTYEGTYKDAYALTNDNIFSSKESFTETKNSVIIEDINDSIEYYINTYNNIILQEDKMYSFTMPTLRGEDWGKILSNPSVIAFLQGVEMSDGYKTLNIYAIAGGELNINLQNNSKTYILTKKHPETIYHVSGCDEINTIHSIMYTLQDVLSSGAVPCNKCMN